MNKAGDVVIAAVASYAAFKLFEYLQGSNSNATVNLIPYSDSPYRIITPATGPIVSPVTPPISDPVTTPDPVTPPVTPSTGQLTTVAWGAKVNQAFRDRVVWCGLNLGIPHNWLMDVMAFESGESFSPSIQNQGGNHYYGLIQFGEAAANAIGTTTTALRGMTAADQLNYVYKYFAQYKGRLGSLADTYMAVLWPAAIGKPMDYILYSSPSNSYTQNKGLDRGRKGYVTKADAAAQVEGKALKGLLPGLVWIGIVHP